MDDVKVVRLPAPPPGVEAHVVALVGRLLEVARQTLLTRDWDGLRPSHFRLLSHVPAEGISITDLSMVLFMTKQGVGQFVTHLQRSGHLEVSIDEQDRRRRLVRRTVQGSRVVGDGDRAIAALELHWERQVGQERYRVFRDVLQQLALDDA